MNLLVRWILMAVALYVTIFLGKVLGFHLWVAPGAAGAIGLFIAVAALAIVNCTIRPLVQLLTLPISCLTFGLFAFVINALMFWLVGSFAPGVHVRGFVAALFGSIVMSVLSGILNSFVTNDKKKGKRL